MTKLLLRLLHCENSKAHGMDAGSLAAVVGMICNAALAAGKLIIGIASGAVSIIADAANNLSDLLSSAVTFLGFHLAKRPADSDHPYGHARYEYLTGLLVALAILFVGVELAKSSIEKIFMPVSVMFTDLMLIVMIVCIAVKLWMMFFYRTLADINGSVTLRAMSQDSRNDAIASSSVLLGCVLTRVFGINADGYIGLTVSLFILWSGVRIVKEMISMLLGKRADDNLTKKLEQLILGHEKVLGIHDLLLHDYGPGRCYGSAHVEIAADEDSLSSHDVIDHIEREVRKKLNVYLVLHCDPVVQNDPVADELHKFVQERLWQIDSRLNIHDFRMVRRPTHIKVMFDVTMPYEMMGQKKAIRDLLTKEIEQKNEDYLAVISFDAQA